MQLLKGSGLTRLLSHSGCNDAALWIVWSVERTTGAAGVDLCAVAAIHAHDIKTKVAIPGARVLAVSRKPNPIRERRRSTRFRVSTRPVTPVRGIVRRRDVYRIKYPWPSAEGPRLPALGPLSRHCGASSTLTCSPRRGFPGPAALKVRQGQSYTWAILMDRRVRQSDW